MDKLIRFDWAIKKLLRHKANFDILEGFLSALLHNDVKVMNLLESESNQEDEQDKFNRVDLLVENAQHELILIEVQVKSEQDFFHRIAYGSAKLLTQYLEKGESYQNLKKVISINITYFELGQGTDYLYYGSTNFVGIHDQDILGLSETQKQLFEYQKINQIFPEYYLIRVGKFTDQIHDAIDEWIYMLKHSEVKPEFKSKNIQHATEKLRVMNLGSEQRQNYERFMDNMSYRASMLWSSKAEGRLEGIQEGIQKGREEGIQKGREEGQKESALTLVKNALQQGLDLPTIASITGLSIEEIQTIRDGSNFRAANFSD
jgi:predicted transposase/invertase (TIGR01784 family)